MLTVYPAFFYEEEEGGYSVIFPDLNHLATCGDDLEDAMKMAIDCLALYIYNARIFGESVAPPSDVSVLDVNSEYDEYKSAHINLVAVDVEDYAKKNFEKSVKKTLTIPKWLNDIAVENDINFSQVLQDALKDKLDLYKG